MSTGALLLPPRYTPLHEGSPVPSGKLRFRATGTSSNQNTYSDSTLDTANANPLSLDANGTLTGLVYGDPTLPAYRIQLLDSSDAVLWTEDDIVVPGADTATYSEGSFTGTLTGMSATTTGTVSYRIVANAAGTGKICTLYFSSAISGTSNSTSMTMTGLAAACTPSVNVRHSIIVIDSGNENHGMMIIPASTSTITFYTDTNLSATGFTNSGTKGLGAGFTVTYPL